MSTRLKLLGVTHLILGCAPLALRSLQIDLPWLALVFVLRSLSTAPLLLLGMWLVLGRNPLRYICATVAPIIYGLVQILALPSLPALSTPDRVFIYGALQVLSAYMVVALTSIPFVVFRRLIGQVILAENVGGEPKRHGQYSLRYALLLIALFGLVAALVRIAITDQTQGGSRLTALCVLMLITLFVGSVAAVWATLSPGKPALHILAALILTAVLGAAISGGNELNMQLRSRSNLGGWQWWLFAINLTSILAIDVVLIVSLLVVRFSGFRLVPNSSDDAAMELSA